MKYDVFASICQTAVDGYLPSEEVMFDQFMDQAVLADELGFETLWIAETHFSCQTQKQSSYAVVPEFEGEIGLNTDTLQMAHKVLNQTKQINIGSAIRNILTVGGPLTHAEALKTFVTLNKEHFDKGRRYKYGFAAGRFDFSNVCFGVRPRFKWEAIAWPQVKLKAFQESGQIFLKALLQKEIGRDEVGVSFLEKSDFKTLEDFQKAFDQYNLEKDEYKQFFNRQLFGLKNINLSWPEKEGIIPVVPFFIFEKVGVFPFDASIDGVDFTVGTHDPKTQSLLNEIHPVSVFNLSITPQKVIEETHQRMESSYNKKRGPWTRDCMPRTCMVFIDDSAGETEEAKNSKAKLKAQKAWENYWRAMAGTLDPEKIKKAVDNTISGSPEKVAQLIKEKYHPEDRLMLWFDFNNHDNAEIKNNMRIFKEKVIPLVEGSHV